MSIPIKTIFDVASLSGIFCVIASSQKVGDRMAAVLKKTTSSSLQLQLEAWVALVNTAISHTNPSLERSDAILAFCRVFVPADVSEDDIDHFSGMLTTDEVIESLSMQVNDAS